MTMINESDTMHAAGELATVRETLTGDFLPMMVDLRRSRGSYLYDRLAGRYILDMGMFFSSSPLGHNPECLDTDRARTELSVGGRLKPSNPDFATDFLAEFVERFREWMMPDGMDRLFLIDGGGAAVENALKVAFDWKAKKIGLPADAECGLEVLHLRRAFHGRTGYTMSLTNTDPAKTARFPKFDWPRIDAPALGEDEGADPFRLELDARERAVVAEVEELLARRADRIACFVYEPIQGEGGDRHLGVGFLRAIEEACVRHDVLTVVDEVQMGGGLTGSRWAHEGMGLTPDLIAFGKKTQVCGVIGGRRVGEVTDNAFIEASRISSTWGGSLADMIRFVHLFSFVDERGLVDRAAGLDAFMKSGLERIVDGSAGQAGSVRVRGLVGALSLTSAALRDEVLRKVFQHHSCVLLPCGERSIRWRPSLMVSQDELQFSFDAVSDSLAAIHAGAAL